MSYHLEPHLLGEICTLKHKHELWIGQIVLIKDELFELQLLEEKVKSVPLGKQPLWITIETIDHEIHLLDVEIVSDSLRDNDRILLLKAVSDLKFQSKRQDTRLPIADEIEMFYREFPPRYYKWEKGSFLNISLGGAQFTGSKYISQGNLIEIKLGPPFFGDDDDEVVISRNVHATSENGDYIFSVQFLNLIESHQTQLKKYIENIYSGLKTPTF
ncbi:PilZ domain-containing protein [Schinkia azotoformans]|uniref:PilZ domain-containing protein n=1 Tax=Schinkia azotoformans LMG 9581 TaxID=1131731 RepID=K6D5T6_SCHAZ|nr:PilZ domain-containing protein [Schinkia azotoformans]EKN67887.1 hypothetical protein BAZO_06729 [Schinkia azotoformans LMG 9581]MEC1637093.1 PilZ domain-containing protein [Schinkia azotoformans]MEC1719881.1 PilZ domain-containing protein [Schinkia azotoformans]MEC1945462.1 PilZ domain-containing protein [Schinkia azotoformans]MED4412551.1 PilZ domain-containing protein [Schinkia azotoformans]